LIQVTSDMYTGKKRPSSQDETEGWLPVENDNLGKQLLLKAPNSFQLTFTPATSQNHLGSKHN
jgi:hypothetical protein